MKYKIDIWTYGYIIESHESDNPEDILDWYKDSGWYGAYDHGGCAFRVYQDGEMLDFDEEYKLGFHS